MDPLHVPFFQLDEQTNKYAVFLPGFRVEDVERLDFRYDPEEEILRIVCQYEESDGPKTEIYPLAITDVNRDAFEQMRQLAVFNPSEYSPDELTSDPRQQENIRTFFEKLENLSSKEPLQEDPRLQPDS